MTTRNKNRLGHGREGTRAAEEKPARRVKAQDGKELVLKGGKGPAEKPSKGKGALKGGIAPPEEITEMELGDLLTENRNMVMALREIDALEVGTGTAAQEAAVIPSCNRRRPAPGCDDYSHGGRKAVEGRRSVDLSQGSDDGRHDEDD